MEAALALSDVYPREALQIDFAHTKGKLVTWKGEPRWKSLQYAREYVSNNPDDYLNRFVYRNLIRSYESGV